MIAHHGRHRLARLALLGMLLALTAGCGSSAVPAALVDETASPTTTATATPVATLAPTPRPSPSPERTPDPVPSVELDPAITAGSEPVLPEGAITAAAAAKHVNKVAIVCGKVVSATYAKTTKGKPTFLNLDKPYPKAIFTIVIWEEDRPAFSQAPEKELLNDWACIQGRVEKYQGVPQITSIGGDVMRPEAFVPWTKDELDCVRRGTGMGYGCETYLEVVIEIRAAEAELGQDMYYDVMDDLSDDYIDTYPDLLNDYTYDDPGWDLYP